MKTVTLDSFYKFEDFELSQYQILDSIKKFRAELHQNKLFPTLDNMVELILQFDNLNMEEICTNITGKNKFSSDYYPYKNENNINEPNDEYVDQVFALIEWARPLIQELVDEGNIIYEFVESNIGLSEISNIKGKKNRGFLLVPDRENSIIHLMHFHLTKTISPFSKNIINTRLIKSFRSKQLNTSSKILSRKIKGEQIDVNKTPVFSCHTDLDFPFAETMFPVIKNKLLLMLLE